MQVNIEENALTKKEYMELREMVDFQRYEEADVEMALERTLYSVVVKEAERVVGIGRVVGDGRIVFFIKDVVVDPEYQHHGIGKTIMKYIMEYIQKAGCNNAYIGLMAVEGTEPFYEQFGFVVRQDHGYGSGMIQFVNKTKEVGHG